jgi:hypothetical protein
MMQVHMRFYCLRPLNARRSKMKLLEDKKEEAYKGKQNIDWLHRFLAESF